MACSFSFRFVLPRPAAAAAGPPAWGLRLSVSESWRLAARRAGRAGASGVVVSLVEPSEEFVMERLGRRLGVRIPMAQLAAGRVEVVERSDGGSGEEGEGGEAGGERDGGGRRRGASRPSVRVLGNPPAGS